MSVRFPPVVVFATTNVGKLSEIRRMLEPIGVTVRSAAEVGLEDVPETAPEFIGNARLKALAAVRATGLPAMADDSGLCVDVLGGRPGVATAHLLESAGGRDAAVGMERLVAAVTDAGATLPAPAQFVAALVFQRPGCPDVVAVGTLGGALVWPPRGRHGHGFDPMFVPRGRDKTLAEMDGAEKNRISHRGRAFRALMSQCFT